MPAGVTGRSAYPTAVAGINGKAGCCMRSFTGIISQINIIIIYIHQNRASPHCNYGSSIAWKRAKDHHCRYRGITSLDKRILIFHI
jgi:hypothetical protein